jgi:hypothetical protein
MSYHGGTGNTGWTGVWPESDRVIYKDDNFALSWADMSQIRDLVKSSPVMFEAMEQFITTYKLLKKDQQLDGS